jgi:hypothetical protein
VNPDYRPAIHPQGGNRPQSLTETGDVLTVTERIEKETRQQQDKGDAKEQAVDEVHM